MGKVYNVSRSLFAFSFCRLAICHATDIKASQLLKASSSRWIIDCWLLLFIFSCFNGQLCFNLHLCFSSLLLGSPIQVELVWVRYKIQHSKQIHILVQQCHEAEKNNTYSMCWFKWQCKDRYFLLLSWSP